VTVLNVDSDGTLQVSEYVTLQNSEIIITKYGSDRRRQDAHSLKPHLRCADVGIIRGANHPGGKMFRTGAKCLAVVW